jgi:hypothetical protein
MSSLEKIPQEERHVYDVEVAWNFLQCIRAHLLIRDWEIYPFDEREYSIQDEETELAAPLLAPLDHFILDTLRAGQWDRPRDRQLALEYAKLSFANLYLLQEKENITNQFTATEFLVAMKPTADEWESILDDVEVLIDRIYDDFDSGLWKDILEDLLTLKIRLFPKNTGKSPTRQDRMQ